MSAFSRIRSGMSGVVLSVSPKSHCLLLVTVHIREREACDCNQPQRQFNCSGQVCSDRRRSSLRCDGQDTTQSGLHGEPAPDSDAARAVGQSRATEVGNEPNPVVQE